MAKGLLRWPTVVGLWCCLLASSPCLSQEPGAAPSLWPQWGGPAGNSEYQGADLPTVWDANLVVWKADLPGQGQSAPAVAGDRLFLTAALAEGRERVVLCLDRRDGRVVWRHSAWQGEPEPSHVMNGWASPMCATDGAVVAAFFGKAGLHAFTVDGQPLWSRNLGPFEGPWGTAASPVLVGDLLIQNCDSDGDAFLLAVDKHTGKDVWRTPRDRIRGWSTPIVLAGADGKPELALNGHHGVRGYDVATGREIWFCKSFNGRGEPVPAYDAEKLYVVNGLRGDVYSIRRGGAAGDVTQSHLAWHTPRDTGRDLSSPVLAGGFLLVMDMKGMLTGYEPSDGRKLWTKRCNGQFSASPLAANGKAYFVNEAGETTVVEPGPDEPLVVAENKLETDDDEIFRSAPIAVAGRIYLRSNRRLYCIGGSDSAAGQ